MPDTVQAPIFFREQEDDLSSVREHARKIALVVNEVLAGKSNNGFAVTLAANATETVVERARVTGESRVVLMPTSASGAAALGTGNLWAETAQGRITLHHDSDAATDRTFDAIIVG